VSVPHLSVSVPHLSVSVHLPCSYEILLEDAGLLAKVDWEALVVDEVRPPSSPFILPATIINNDNQ